VTEPLTGINLQTFQVVGNDILPKLAYLKE